MRGEQALLRPAVQRDETPDSASPDSVGMRWGRFRSDLEPTYHRQHNRVLIRDPRTGKVYAFSEAAFALLEKLEPEVSLEEALAHRLGRAPSAELLGSMTRFLNSAANAGLLSRDGDPNWIGVDRRPNRANRWPNPFFIMIPLVNPQRLLPMLRSFSRPLFSRRALVAWALGLAATITMLAVRSQDYSGSFAFFRATRSWVIVYVLLFLATIVHEWGHAFACDRFGVEVKRAGLLLYLLTPGAYADISGAWLLSSTRERIAISLGGVYLEAYLWMAASWLWLATNHGSAVHALAFVSSIILAVRIAVNLIPFLRLDGYWVLVDLLGIPNLRAKSVRYLLSCLPWVGRHWTPLRKPGLQQSVILAGYGLASTTLTIYSILVALGKIHIWLLRSSPDAGGVLFGILVAILSVFAVLYLFKRLINLSKSQVS